MFEDPVIVLEGQPLRAAFQTNLAIKSGIGLATHFRSDPQGGSTPPSLQIEVGNTQWWPFPTNGEFSRPENWRMRWYQGLIFTELIIFSYEDDNFERGEKYKRRRYKTKKSLS